MHLIETYANYCGVKLPASGSTFPDLFYPTPDKYITVHNGSGMEAKNYDYYNDVLSLLAQPLAQEGIQIVQIGTKSESSLKFCHHVNKENLTLRQSAYVVRGAMLHLGNDSLWQHFAGLAEVPVVSLYGPTNHEVCRPYYGDKQTLLSHQKKDWRTTNSPNEKPKTINEIKPEDVANSVLKMLSIDYSIPVETIFIGDKYTKPIVELIPNFVLPPSNEDFGILNIRYDYYNDPEKLAHNLAIRRCSITTNTPIDSGILKHFKANIDSVIYFLEPQKSTAKISPEFVDSLIELGINYMLVSYEEDKGHQDELKMKFFDYKIINFLKHPVMPKIGITPKSWMKTTRILLANGQKFASKAHWLNNEPITSAVSLLGDYIEDKNFWNTKDHLYILNYRTNQ